MSSGLEVEQSALEATLPVLAAGLSGHTPPPAIQAPEVCLDLVDEAAAVLGGTPTHQRGQVILDRGAWCLFASGRSAVDTSRTSESEQAAEEIASRIEGGETEVTGLGSAASWSELMANLTVADGDRIVQVQVRPAEGADLEAAKKVALAWLDAAE